MLIYMCLFILIYIGVISYNKRYIKKKIVMDIMYIDFDLEIILPF